MPQNNKVEVTLVYNDKASAQIQSSTKKLKTSFDETAESAKKAAEAEKKAAEAAAKAHKETEKATDAASKKTKEYNKNLKELGLQSIGVGEKLGKLGVAFIAVAVAAKAIQTIGTYFVAAANAAYAAAIAEEKVTGKINEGAAAWKARKEELEKTKLLLGQMVIDSGVLNSWQELQITIANIATDAFRGWTYLLGISQEGKFENLNKELKTTEGNLVNLEKALATVQGGGGDAGSRTPENIGNLQAMIEGKKDELARLKREIEDLASNYKPEGAGPKTAAELDAQQKIDDAKKKADDERKAAAEKQAAYEKELREKDYAAGQRQEDERNANKDRRAKEQQALIDKEYADNEKKEAERNAAKAKREEDTKELKTKLALEKNKDDPVALLEMQKQQELDVVGRTEEQKKLIEDRYRLLSINAEKAAAEKKKQLQIALGFSVANQAVQTFSAIAEASKADGNTKKRIAQAGVAINTAEAVTKVLAQTGVGAAFLIPLIIAQGVAQAAIIERQKYALGTNSARGGRALVGERGPEEVELPTGSRVYNAQQTRERNNQRTVTTNLYVTATTTAVVEDIIRMAKTGEADSLIRALR